MSKLDGIWTELSPVQQFLYYDKIWSNFFNCHNEMTFKLVEHAGDIKPSASSFTQISGGVLARW
jgi:hypothetical protein